MLGRARFYREDQPRDEHGRWGEGGGSAAEKVGTGTPTAPASTPGLITPGTRPVVGAGRGPTDPRWTVRTGNNKIVTMRLGAESGDLAVAGQRPDPAMIAKVLNGVADAYERDPRPDGPPDVVLHSTAGYAERLRGRGMSDEEATRTAANTRASVESSRPWEINVVAGTATAEYHGNYMPSSAALAAKGELLAGTMAHEYGHVRFFETVTKDRVNKETALFVRPDIKASLSAYGRSNHLEAVAEAYSEWHLTGGRTDNLAAKTYAEQLGWKKPKAQTAGRVERFEFDESQHPRDEHGRFGQGSGGGAEGSRYSYDGVPSDKMWSEMSHGERRAADPLFRAWDDVTKGGQFIPDLEDRARLHPERYVDRRESFPKGIPGPVLRLGQVETQLRRAADGSAELYDMTPLPLGKTFDDIPKGAKVDMSGGEKGRPLVEVAGSGRALDYSYRIVSEAEYAQAKERGFFRSDGRMNLGSQEGTVMSASSTGGFYRPHGELAHIVRFNYDKAWKVDPADQYIKAPPDVKIPLSKVDRVVGPIDPNPDDVKRAKLATIRSLTGQLGLAFEWDADKHPKDEQGRWAPSGGGGGGGGKAEPVSISSLPPGSWETQPQKWATTAYQMKGSNFSTQVEQAYTHNYELHVKGSIYSELTGGKVGNFERKVFAAANADGTVDNVVEHELLILDKSAEGHHIAAEFNAHAEEAYKAAGITRIDLHANIDVGGYAWARAGYEWDPKSSGARTVGDHVANLNDQWERWGHHTSPMATGEHFTPNLSELPDRKVIQKAVEEQHDKLFNDEVAAAAAKLAADPNLKVRDVAQLGYKQGAVIKAENGQRYWAGKLLLMGQHWYGSKRLAPAMTPAEYEAQDKKLQHATATTATLARKPRPVQESQPDPALKARLKAAGAPDYNYPPVDWEDKGDGPVDFGPEPVTEQRAEKLSEIRELVAEFARKRKRKRTVARIPQIYQRHPMPLYQPLPPPAPTPSPPPAPAPGDGGSPPAPPSGGGAPAAPASAEVTQLYSEDQPREHGRFAPAGGGGAGDTAKGDKAAKAEKPAVPKERVVRPVKGMKVDGQAVNAWAVKTADGQKVKLYQVPHIGIGGVEHGAVRPETVSKLLNGVANAYDRDPRPEGKGAPTIRIESTGDYYGRLRDQGVDEKRAFDMMRTTLAYVDSSRPGEITALRQNIDQPPSETPKLDSIMGGTGWHMPAEEALKAQGNAAVATMAHEYGHVRYYDNANWTVPASGGMRDAVLRDRKYYQDKANLLLYKPEVRAALSEYGKSNYMEAHAEAYAEWSLTDGKTDNFAAKAFAEGFGWNRRKAQTAGDVEEFAMQDKHAKLAEVRRLAAELLAEPIRQRGEAAGRNGAISAFEFDPEKHPKDERGRWAESGAGSAGASEEGKGWTPLNAPSGMAAIPAGTMPKIDARLEALMGKGMTNEKVVATFRDNALASVEGEGLAQAHWYEEKHQQLAIAAAEAGLKGDIGVGALAAMTAVTSGTTSWEQNIACSTSMAHHLGADTPVSFDKANLDEYNRWAANRGSGTRGPDGNMLIQAHDELTVEHLQSIGGTKNPDGSVSIGIRTLAERYGDVAAARMPGQKVLNSDFMVKAVEIYKAGERQDAKAIDAMVGGPKERSFVNNLAKPNDPTNITVDRWQWKALAGDLPISFGSKGETHTLPQWMSDTTGTNPAHPSAQAIFQSAPNDKKNDYGPGIGLYPLGVEAMRQATDVYNQRHPDAHLSYAGFQAVSWYASIRAGASVTHPAR